MAVGAADARAGTTRTHASKETAARANDFDRTGTPWVRTALPGFGGDLWESCRSVQDASGSAMYEASPGAKKMVLSAGLSSARWFGVSAE